MTTPTMTPAGWYPDPSLRHEYRYWDGTVWTPDVSDRGLPATDPELRPPTNPPGAPAGLPGPSPEPPALSRPTAAPVATRAGRRRWVVAVIAIVAVLLVIAGLVIWAAPWGSELPGTPNAVHQQARTSTSVLVQWDPPATSPTVDRYLILRDGIEIGSVPGTVTSYKDTGLTANTVYEYRVVAVSGDVWSIPSPSIVVKTLLPPI